MRQLCRKGSLSLLNRKSDKVVREEGVNPLFLKIATGPADVGNRQLPLTLDNFAPADQTPHPATRTEFVACIIKWQKYINLLSVCSLVHILAHVERKSSYCHRF